MLRDGKPSLYPKADAIDLHPQALLQLLVSDDDGLYLAGAASARTLEVWIYATVPPFAALDSVIDLPFGYEAGLRWNLAVNLAPEYGRPIDQVGSRERAELQGFAGAIERRQPDEIPGAGGAAGGDLVIKTFGAQPFAANGAATCLARQAVRSLPGAVATDSSLAIAVDRQQTRLALPLNATDTAMTVVNPSVIVAYCLLTIDAETVKVTSAPAGNVVPISRGFDGTTPALHLASATVSGFIDAYHHNALVAEIEAIETVSGRTCRASRRLPLPFRSPANFAPLTPGGALTPGTNVITLAPVPAGVNGTDKSHYLWIDQGTGTPEAVPITGGTAVAGAPSGTLFFTCANAHTGAWRISSATSGIQEAVQSLDTGGNGGTVLIPAANWPTHAPITIDARCISLQGSGMGASIITADLSVCPAIQIGTGNRGVPTYNGITNLTVTRAAGTIPTNCIGVLWLFYNMGYTQNVEYSRHYVGEKATHTGGSITIGLLSDGCRMWGNTYANIWCEHVAGVKYSRLYMGSAVETQAGQTAPTYGAVISADANDIKFNECDWLSPVTAPATAMQWGVLFTAMPPGTGMFIFNDCNWENIAQGIVKSDATCTNLRWLEFNADGAAMR
mgnify:CR=1 FL=1